MADADPSELDQLRQENARLIGLLEAHGIAWRSGEPAPTKPAPFGEGDSEAAPAKGPSSTREKVTLFRSLFRGRDDVYALRRQSSSGRSGYAPACANEWRPGLCEKPRISCRDCNHRELQPLSDAAIYGHLARRGNPTLSQRGCRRGWTVLNHHRENVRLNKIAAGATGGKDNKRQNQAPHHEAAAL